MTQLSLQAIDEPSPAALAVRDTRPLVECDKCGCLSFRDKPIHDGRSTVRGCNFCGRFMGFPVWYGVEEKSRRLSAVGCQPEMGAA